MKQFYLLISLFIITNSVFGQVGIGTTTPKATLDIAIADPTNPSFADGLLIPRMDVLPAVDPKDDQHGMLVYLTAADGGYSPGFLYWDKNSGTTGKWIPFENGWKITGNNNVTSGTHFIGTTNAQEVDFRVNDKHIARLTEKGQLELEADEKSVLIGFEAGENYDPAGTAAEQNVFIGYQAATSSTSGRDNVAVGTFSMKANTTGNFNVGVGDETLENNNIGSNNTALGNDGLRANTWGSDNTAIGRDALLLNIGGNRNTAIGMNALDSNDYGTGNVAIGHDAGETLEDGSGNIFIGEDADSNIGTISDAIAIGSGSLVSASNTIALGASTIAQPEETIAIGVRTAVEGTSTRSLAIGYNASIDGAAENSIVIGTNSVINNNASNSLAVGNNISLAGGVQNGIGIGNNIVINNGNDDSIALGNGATVTKANQLCYGSISEINQGTATVVNTSDGRFKYAVHENVPGLDFINRLRPVTYKFDLAKLDNFHGVQNSRRNTDKIETGFIAQEIEEAMRAVGYDFNGLVVPEDKDTDNYSVSYSTFVVPLVKAVQEQQEEIDSLKEQIKSLQQVKEELSQIKALLEASGTK